MLCHSKGRQQLDLTASGQEQSSLLNLTFHITAAVMGSGLFGSLGKPLTKQRGPEPRGGMFAC